MDTFWDDAAGRAERAEREPGVTPYRRGVARLAIEPLTAVIEAKLANKAHLPHGRLGELLQLVKPRQLAIMTLEAVAPQIGRRRRRRDEVSFEGALKEQIGDVFYANTRMAANLKEAKKLPIEERRRARWRARVLQGKLKRKRDETFKQWQNRLRKTRFAAWKSLLQDVSRKEKVHAGSWLLQCVAEADIFILVGKDLLPTDRWRKRNFNVSLSGLTSGFCLRRIAPRRGRAWRSSVLDCRFASSPTGARNYVLRTLRVFNPSASVSAILRH